LVIKALTHSRRVQNEGEPSQHPGGHEQINLIRTSRTTAARRRDLRQIGRDALFGWLSVGMIRSR
jgi:hypothetical protein